MVCGLENGLREPLEDKKEVKMRFYKYPVILLILALIANGCHKEEPTEPQQQTTYTATYNDQTGLLRAERCQIYYGSDVYSDSAYIADTALVVIVTPDSNYYFYTPQQGSLSSISDTTSKEAIWLIIKDYLGSQKSIIDTTDPGVVFKPLTDSTVELANLKHRWAGVEIRGPLDNSHTILIKPRKLLSIELLNILQREWPVSFNQVPIDTTSYCYNDTAYVYGANGMVATFPPAQTYFYINYLSDIIHFAPDHLSLCARVEAAGILDLVFKVIDAFIPLGQGTNVLVNCINTITLRAIENTVKNGMLSLLDANITPSEYAEGFVQTVIGSVIDELLDCFSSGKKSYFIPSKTVNKLRLDDYEDVHQQTADAHYKNGDKSIIAAIAVALKALKIALFVVDNVAEIYDEAVTPPTGMYVFESEDQNFIFIENFDSYPVGGIPDTTVWDVGIVNPSDLEIVSSGYINNGLKFSDPTVDTVDNSYASILTNITGVYTNVTFYVNTQTNNVDCGIRAVGDLNYYWSTMSWYLYFKGDSVYYYYYDSYDSSYSFIPIAKINPGVWYKFEVIIDWSTSSYSIYINGNFVSQATFVSPTNAGGAYLHLVEFGNSSLPTDGFIVDEIVLSGPTKIGTKFVRKPRFSLAKGLNSQVSKTELKQDDRR